MYDLRYAQDMHITGYVIHAALKWGLQRQTHTLAKLIKEMRPNADAPTKEAVAAVAIAETENKVPMFIMHVASISEFVIFWLACTKTTRQNRHPCACHAAFCTLRDATRDHTYGLGEKTLHNALILLRSENASM